MSVETCLRDVIRIQRLPKRVDRTWGSPPAPIVAYRARRASDQPGGTELVIGLLHGKGFMADGPERVVGTDLTPVVDPDADSNRPSRAARHRRTIADRRHPTHPGPSLAIGRSWFESGLRQSVDRMSAEGRGPHRPPRCGRPCVAKRTRRIA